MSNSSNAHTVCVSFSRPSLYNKIWSIFCKSIFMQLTALFSSLSIIISCGHCLLMDLESQTLVEKAFLLFPMFRSPHELIFITCLSLYFAFINDQAISCIFWTVFERKFHNFQIFNFRRDLSVAWYIHLICCNFPFLFRARLYMLHQLKK